MEKMDIIQKGNIKLVKINTENIDDIINLSVDEKQKEYITSNIYSIAEAYATISEGRIAMPFGIYNGNIPLGFIMIGFDYYNKKIKKVPYFIENNYMIWRFMIDKNYQNKGIGKEALRIALDYIHTFPFGKAKYCWLSYEPENKAAKALYSSFGFEERSDYYVEGGEMPATLRL